MTSINELLDKLPRTRLRRLEREAPAYRALGVAGFYGALIVTLAGGLLTGRSLLVLGILALVCGVSFFVYAWVRRWLVGQEEIVLLEHVWFALACCAVVLWSLREPIAGYLDIVSLGMCLFLAAGRFGCTLVGCCYGRPASIGISYGEACAQDGFPKDFAGVRLLPVPAMEMTGLLVIGAAGMLALPHARPGAVLTWFLAAYSILRFGLEGLRGDPRPHFLGLSQARWMSVAELAAILWWSEGRALHGFRFEVACGLIIVFLVILALRHAFNWRRRILKASHLAEVRATIATDLPLHPNVHVTTSGVRIAASNSGAAFGSEAHVSISLPDDRRDLLLLCELGVRAFPGVSPQAAYVIGGTVLHLLIPIQARLSMEQAEGRFTANLGRALYGAVLRHMQRSTESPVAAPRDSEEECRSWQRPWYFTVSETQRG